MTKNPMSNSGNETPMQDQDPLGELRTRFVRLTTLLDLSVRDLEIRIRDLMQGDDGSKEAASTIRGTLAMANTAVAGAMKLTEKLEEMELTHGAQDIDFDALRKSIADRLDRIRKHRAAG